MQGHVYHWKHGWIPLTHTAAMVKAKGSRSGASRYARQYHIEDRRAGEDRRTTEREAGRAAGPTTRGGFEYKKGTRTRDYPQRDPAGHEAPQEAPAGGPKSAGEAFKMRKAELEPHAKAGNTHAQAELDRRAAKRAGKAAPAPKAEPKAAPKAEKPAAPKAPEPKAAPAPKAPEPKAAPAPEGKRAPKTMAEHEADNRAIEKALGNGHMIGTLPVSEGTVIHQHADANGKILGSVLDFGDGDYGVTSVGDEQPTFHKTRLAAHQHIAKRDQPTVAPYDGSAGQRAANAAKMFGHGSDQHQKALEAEDEAITKALPDGEMVNSSLGRYYANGTSGTYVNSRHYTDNGDSMGRRNVGSVREDPETGKFTVEHNAVVPSRARGRLTRTDTRKLPGQYDSRAEAHAALSKADADHEAKKAAKAAKQAQAAGNVTAGVAGPNGGKWETHNLDDGTFQGRVKAAKAKQAFKSGNKTVVIETPMSEAETKAFLGDVTDVLDRAGANAHHIPVTVRVPTGDAEFKWNPAGGNTGGYVFYGDSTIHVNPVVARGEAKAESGFGHSHSGHFMEGNATTHGRAWVLTHELGHVVDGANGHSRERKGYSLAEREEAKALAHEHRHGFGVYGRKNAAEAYAEAFAQHQLGGEGSSPTADAYAKKFGWAAPASKYTDPTRPAKPTAAESTKAAEDFGAYLGRETAGTTATGSKYQTATQTGRGAGGSSGF